LTISLIIPGVGPFEVSLEAPLGPVHSQLLRKDDRQKFWLKAGTVWPDDVFGKVFLARAVDALGRAKFGDDWSGYKPSVDLDLQPLPAMQFGAQPWQLAEARNLVPQSDDDGPIPRQRPSFSGQQWSQARALRQSALDLIDGPRRRLAAVKSALHFAIRDGNLKAYFLGLSGGEFSADATMPAHWNTTPRVLDNRFYCCQMDPSHPFDLGVAGTGHKWIFVDGKELQKIAMPVPDDAEKRKETLHTAHYPRFVARVRDAVRASPNGPVLRDELIKEGREVYKLTKENAEKAYLEGLDAAAVPHEWSRRGPKPKAKSTA
jgi:hypothetical protein